MNVRKRLVQERKAIINSIAWEKDKNVFRRGLDKLGKVQNLILNYDFHIRQYVKYGITL